MRALAILLCVALGGCVGDQAMNYGAPAPVRPVVQPVQPIAPIAQPVTPGVLPAIRPYNPPGLAPIPVVPQPTMPGVLPPLRPVYPQ